MLPQAQNVVRTPGFMGQAVEWSMFEPGVVAVAASQHFGIVGNGRLFILRYSPSGTRIERHFDTNNACFDVAWNEQRRTQLVAACGDGSLRLFDTKSQETRPLVAYSEHAAEVTSVAWNTRRQERFASASWDTTVKLWTTGRPHSFQTLVGHDDCIHEVAWLTA
ncbi:MAG: hypothetical protein MHM6MM_009605, partial [Cercozoa sp. M6MM]